MKKVKKILLQKRKRSRKIKGISYNNLLNTRYKKDRQTWKEFCKKNNLTEKDIDLDGFRLLIGFNPQKRILYM